MEYVTETGQHNKPEEVNFKKREGSISMREALVWDQLAALLWGRWKVACYGRSTQRMLLLKVSNFELTN